MQYGHKRHKKHKAQIEANLGLAPRTMQHGHKRHKKHKGRLEQQRLEAIEEQCSGPLCPRGMAEADTTKAQGG